MLPQLLLYTTLSCQQTDALMLRIQADENLAEPLKVELVETVRDSAPECDWYWDAND